MTPEQTLAALGSLPFIAAATALLRKAMPSIDGKLVYGLVSFLTALTALLTIYASQLPVWVWVVLQAVAIGVIAAGGTAYYDKRNEKLADALASAVAKPAAPQPAKDATETILPPKDGQP